MTTVHMSIAPRLERNYQTETHSRTEELHISVGTRKSSLSCSACGHANRTLHTHLFAHTQIEAATVKYSPKCDYLDKLIQCECVCEGWEQLCKCYMKK